MVWVGIDFLTPGIGGNASAIVSVGSAGLLLLRPFTVVRTRGIIRVISDQVAAQEEYEGVVAAEVVTQAASIGGIGSIPTPLTESDGDYFMYEPFLGLQVAATGNNHPVTFNVDSKAMRKIGVDDQIVFVAQTSVGSQGVDVAMVGRMLIKLH